MSIIELLTCVISSLIYVPGEIITVILIITMMSISWIDALSDGLLVMA